MVKYFILVEEFIILSMGGDSVYLTESNRREREEREEEKIELEVNYCRSGENKGGHHREGLMKGGCEHQGNRPPPPPLSVKIGKREGSAELRIHGKRGVFLGQDLIGGEIRSCS